MSRAFYGCECGVRWGHGRQGQGEASWSRPPGSPLHPQGWHTAATCPRCGPTCQRWCITTSSRPPAPQGPQGASPRTCGASIRRMKRCTLWGPGPGPGRAEAGSGGCRVSALGAAVTGPLGIQVNHSCGRADRPRLMALEWPGHGGLSDSGGCGFPWEGRWVGSPFCSPITPQPWANLCTSLGFASSLEGGG